VHQIPQQLVSLGQKKEKQKQIHRSALERKIYQTLLHSIRSLKSIQFDILKLYRGRKKSSVVAIKPMWKVNLNRAAINNRKNEGRS
jgi:hypothetical protein